MRAEPTSGARATCLLCDADDVLGIGLCAGCIGTDLAKRDLLFARAARGNTGAERQLRRLVGASDPGLPNALRSGRPLLAVPAGVSTRVVPALQKSGLIARSVPVANSWQALPSHFWVMLFCMLGAGMLAGLVTDPSFLWLSPVLALSFLFVGQRSMQRPILPAGGVAGLDRALHAEVARTMLALHPGDARDRLVDLLRIARPLVRELEAHGDPAGIRDSVQDLVRAACETARETERLTKSADVIRSSLVWTTEIAGEKRADSARSVLLRCSDLARRGVAQLADAVVALGRVDADAADVDGPVGSELSELTHQLEAAARLHVETYRELQGLTA